MYIFGCFVACFEVMYLNNNIIGIMSTVVYLQS